MQSWILEFNIGLRGIRFAADRVGFKHLHLFEYQILQYTMGRNCMVPFICCVIDIIFSRTIGVSNRIVAAMQTTRKLKLFIPCNNVRNNKMIVPNTLPRYFCVFRVRQSAYMRTKRYPIDRAEMYFFNLKRLLPCTIQSTAC